MIYVAIVVGLANAPWANDWFKPGTLSFEIAKGLPAGFVAVVAAAIGGSIAWRQYRVAADKLRLDLFEHRLEVFRRVNLFLRSGSTADGQSNVDIFRSLHEARFLFDASVAAKIDEWRLAVQETKMTQTQQDPAAEQRRQAMVKAAQAKVQAAWQHDIVAVFEPFMSFSNWRSSQ
jgi:hypothetical protein